MKSKTIKKSLYFIFLVISSLLLLCGCGTDVSNTEHDDKLVVYTSHPVALRDPLLEKFEAETGITVEVVAGGTGELLEHIASESGNPRGDIFFGGSISTVQPHLDLFETYTSVNEEHMLPEFKNTEGKMTRFTVLPSILMINMDLIGDTQVEGYEDLLKPELKGKIAMADPSRSSAAYEQLICMLYDMGNGNPEHGWDYIKSFCHNLDGKLLGTSAAVYKSVADGEYAVGLTFEESAARYVAEGYPISIAYMKEGMPYVADGVAIIRRATHMDEAKKFVDFITSQETQQFIADNLYRRSVRDDVSTPPGLRAKETIKIIHEDSQVIVDSKARWLTRFADIFNSDH